MVFGSAAQNLTSFIKWIKLFKEKKTLNVAICAVEYRKYTKSCKKTVYNCLIFLPQLLYTVGLAPENPVPAQYEDVAAAYTHIVRDLGVSSTKIIIGMFLFWLLLWL